MPPSDVPAASSNNSVRFRFPRMDSMKQNRFAGKRSERIREPSVSHEELENYSESEGNNSVVEYGITEAGIEDHEHLSSSFTSSMNSSFNSTGSSLSSGLRDSFNSHGALVTPRPLLKDKMSKAWLKESAFPFRKDDDDLVELNEEDDEDDEEDAITTATAGNRERTIKATSEKIGQTIYALKDPDSGPMKTAYYMSRLRAWTLDEDGRYRAEIAKLGGLEAIVSAMWTQLVAYEAELLNEKEDRARESKMQDLKKSDHTAGTEDDEGSLEEEEDDNDEIYFMRIQQLGVASLANMARDPSLCAAVDASGGTKSIGTAMDKFPTNANLQEKACDAIGTLARNRDVREKLVKEYNAVEQVLNGMDKAADDVYVQRRGCIALFRLATAGAAACKAIGKAGAVEVVLSTMRNHLDDAKTQRLGCGVLKALAKRCEANKFRICVAKGGLSAIIEAMKRHEDDSSVQEEGCRLFGHLTICHLERKFSIARSGALDRIILAMKRHTDSSKVQLAGCVALLNLTTKVELAQMANAHGALPVVRHAAKEHCPGQARKLITRLRIAKYAPIVFMG
eukprot:CAMPEP_0172449326 /NCGR_PEP_ID=MMETSP1065-20121228/8065_1 /TAXON_ID=265537 /ORGANISM="Amphiprora paludosa, Strain CCMP125" /LENGTH=565 /DNA_ID=CAMNT_0013200983 /DNA_START=262 /DNA_END=1959 /DNA_ORIENTATION=-